MGPTVDCGEKGGGGGYPCARICKQKGLCVRMPWSHLVRHWCSGVKALTSGHCRDGGIIWQPTAVLGISPVQYINGQCGLCCEQTQGTHTWMF
jgi:hypothetical protein